MGGGVGRDEGVEGGRDARVGAALQLQRAAASELRLRAQEFRLAPDSAGRGGRGLEASEGHPLWRQVRGILAERLTAPRRAPPMKRSLVQGGLRRTGPSEREVAK